jgi:molybdopterin converting factor subunit 1
MKITVRLFARARELAERDSVVVELPAGATVAALREAIGREVPALASFVKRCAVALGGEYAVDADAVAEGTEAALIPPVSGGSESSSLAD